jgi:hypothetical protein
LIDACDVAAFAPVLLARDNGKRYRRSEDQEDQEAFFQVQPVFPQEELQTPNAAETTRTFQAMLWLSSG